MNLKKNNAMETIDISEKFTNNTEESILIVDDSKFSRKILNDILLEEGFHIITEARNGQEAVELVKEKKPKYVFLDVEMPVLDGLGALPLILEIHPGANVIMCTAMGQQNIIEEAVREGAKDYVLKPYKKESIVTIMNAMTVINNRQVIPFERGKRNQDKGTEAAKLDFIVEEISAVDNLDACKEELVELSRASDEEVKQLIDSIESVSLDGLSEVTDFVGQAQETDPITDDIKGVEAEIVKIGESIDEAIEGLEVPVEQLIDFIISEKEKAQIESIKEEPEIDANTKQADEIEVSDDAIRSEGFNNAEKVIEEKASDDLASNELIITELLSEEIAQEELSKEETEQETIEQETIEQETIEQETIQQETIQREVIKQETIQLEVVKQGDGIEDAAKEKLTKTEATEEDSVFVVLAKTKDDNVGTEKGNSNAAVVPAHDELPKVQQIQDRLIMVEQHESEHFKEEQQTEDTLVKEQANEEGVINEFVSEDNIKEGIVEDGVVNEGHVSSEAREEEDDQEEYVKELVDEIELVVTEDIVRKEAGVLKEILTDQEISEEMIISREKIVLNEVASDNSVSRFDYLWMDRFGNRKRAPNDPVFNQNRISSHSVIHSNENSNKQIDMKQSELMLGLTSAYLCFNGRLQPEHYISFRLQLFEQEGIRVFTDSTFPRRYKTKAPITMTEILKLAAKKKQYTTNYLSNAIVHLVEGKIERLLS